MLKGKLGITLSAVAALSFVLAYFGYMDVLVLVVAYALIVEGSNWLTKQTLQALYVSIALNIINQVLGWIFGGAIKFFNFINFNGAVGFVSGFQTVCDGIVTLAFLALCIYAIFKVIKDKDVNLPLIGKLADASLGIIKPKTAQQPQYAAPVQPSGTYSQPVQPVPVQQFQPKPVPPVQPAPVQPLQPIPPVPPVLTKPVQPVQPVPVQPNPVQPVQSASVQTVERTTMEPSDQVRPAAPSSWICTCGKENTGKFCSICGAKNPNL
jgi:uncharacterized membrane protein